MGRPKKTETVVSAPEVQNLPQKTVKVSGNVELEVLVKSISDSVTAKINARLDEIVAALKEEKKSEEVKEKDDEKAKKSFDAKTFLVYAFPAICIVYFALKTIFLFLK